MQFDALEKSVMRLQITAFKNCNKKDTIMQRLLKIKSLYFEQMFILKNNLMKTEIHPSFKK